jgi:hypothetical protein
VRLALLSISMGEPRGQVVPAAALAQRVEEVLTAQRDCRSAVVGERLPGLVRDLHSTLATGRDQADLLRLLAVTHVQGTQAWLMDIGAPLDLAWQAVALARQAAEQLADDQMALAISAFGTSFGLMGAGAFDVAGRALAEPAPGTGTSETMQVTGMLALTTSLLAAAQGDQAERVAAVEYATDLAERTGEGNALWFGFGPANVGVWRMSIALEACEHAEAARIATTVDPAAPPSPTRRSAYWREYGRALARLPRRQDEAVLMLRRAEDIASARIHRHPFMRSIIAELLMKAKRDAVGRELRGMAFRAGLPV